MRRLGPTRARLVTELSESIQIQAIGARRAHKSDAFDLVCYTVAGTGVGVGVFVGSALAVDPTSTVTAPNLSRD